MNSETGGTTSALPNSIILFIGFAVLFVSGGSRFALSLMLKPMTEDLGWGRALVSLVGMMFMAVSALGQPVVGRLVDRYNPLWIVATGLLLSSVGLAFMGAVTSVWYALLVYGLIFGVGQAATSVTPVSVMVLRSYSARRGFATSVAVSGSATGQLVVMGVVAAVLSYLGWRKAYGLLGAVNFLVVIGLAGIIRSRFRRPAPSSATPHPLPPLFPHADSRILSIREIRLLLVVYTICGLQDFFVSTHVVAFATDQGVDAFWAGNVLALMGLMGLIGVLISGALADTFGPVLPTALSFGTRLCLFGYIPFMHDETSVIVFALVYGATFLVTAPLVVVFAEQSVGPAQMGWVSGVLIMVHQIAGGIGAFLGGSVFDLWGSYNTVFLIMFGLSIVAIWTTWTLRGRETARLMP